MGGARGWARPAAGAPPASRPSPTPCTPPTNPSTPSLPQILDLLDAKDLFKKEIHLPNKTFPEKEYKQWPDMSAKKGFDRVEVKKYDLQKPSNPVVDAKFKKASDELDAHVKAMQAKFDKVNKELLGKVEPAKNVSKEFKKAYNISKTIGKIYKAKTPVVTYPTWPNKDATGAKVWNEVYNKTHLGSIKGNPLPNPKFKPIVRAWFEGVAGGRRV